MISIIAGIMSNHYVNGVKLTYQVVSYENGVLCLDVLQKKQGDILSINLLNERGMS